MLLFNLLPFGSVCHICFLGSFCGEREGFIATVFRLAMPRCGNLNVLVMYTSKLISILLGNVVYVASINIQMID